MKHKFTTTPSLGWLNARFGRYINQRVRFYVKEEHWCIKHMEEVFDTTRPVEVRAIFAGLFKRHRKPNSFGMGPCRECEVEFLFRDVIFVQDGKEMWLLNHTRRQNKRFQQGFWWNEIKGGGFIDNQEGFSPIQGLLTQT